MSIIGAPAAGNTTNVYHSIEIDPVSGEIWASICGNGSLDAGTGRNYDCLVYYDGTTHNIHTNGTSGQLRYLRRLGLMALHERDAGATGGGAQTTSLHLYSTATHARVQTVTVPADLWAWSLRVIEQGNDRFIVGLYTDSGKTYLRVWDTSWNTLADYRISDTLPAVSNVIGYRAFITVFTDDQIGEVGKRWAAAGMPVCAPLETGAPPACPLPPA